MDTKPLNTINDAQSFQDPIVEAQPPSSSDIVTPKVSEPIKDVITSVESPVEPEMVPTTVDTPMVEETTNL